jgi:FKBP-type peptidyl-prolyl cis-trans isomerase FklB
MGQEVSTTSSGQPVSAASQPQTEGNKQETAKPEASSAEASQAETSTGSKSEPATGVVPADAPVVNNRKDKISYAFGVDLARDLKRQKQDLNVDLLMRALTDALADKPLVMTDEQVTATLKQVEAEQKQDFEHAKRMISEKNKKAGEAFFAENAKKEGVVTLPSGLQYKVLKKGDGKVPTLDDRVVCKYKGALLDGTEFDNSDKRGGQVTVPLKGLMSGWTQALQMMPVGSKWQLFIPPQLAYGDKIMYGLGPNTTLIFEVELVSIEDKPQIVGTK